MDTFFNTLKKGLVAMLFVVVGFAMTYVPQLPSSHVQPVHAGGAGVGATEFTQMANNTLLGAGNVINSVTAGAVSSNWLKENVLDGLGWAIAKRIVSGMVRSLINWVNSGFQGSPAFVTDLQGFMLNIADEEIGRVISGIGGEDGIGSFICSPFRLDIQVSIAMQYAQGRAGQSAPTCTLTGVIDNIEGFISGIDPGNGLSDWLAITSTPQTYTPYGAVLNAEIATRARIINAQGRELTQVNWGDGFLSQKICESVGGDTNNQQCSISKPGRVIADQLNKALGAGQDALIQADEINELISALLGQLANQALTGVSGLLGLSGGTGFTYSGYDGSYLDQLVNESDAIVGNAGDEGAKSVVTRQLALQIEYRDMLLAYQAGFTDFTTPQEVDPTQTNQRAENLTPAQQRERTERNNRTIYRQEALRELEDITIQIERTEEDIMTLFDIAVQYDTVEPERQVELLIAFTNFPSISNNDISTEQARLDRMASTVSLTAPAIQRTENLTELLAELDPAIVVDPTDENWINLAASLRLEVQ